MIRIATIDDAGIINEIYNQAIKNKFSTADQSALPVSYHKEWLSTKDLTKEPVFVFEEEDIVKGWMSLSYYRKRAALIRTAEVSYYVHRAYQKRSVGTKLLEHAIKVASDYNFSTLIAILLDPNEGSIQLLKKFNFEEWGRMPGIAENDGSRYDHLYYGLHL